MVSGRTVVTRRMFLILAFCDVLRTITVGLLSPFIGGCLGVLT